jgi:hypothetical protein
MAQAYSSAEPNEGRSAPRQDHTIVIHGFHPSAHYTGGGGAQGVEPHMGSTAILGPNFWTRQLNSERTFITVLGVGLEPEGFDFCFKHPPQCPELDHDVARLNNSYQSLDTNSFLSSQHSLATRECVLNTLQIPETDMFKDMDIKDNFGAGLDFDTDFAVGLVDLFDFQLEDQVATSRSKRSTTDMTGHENIANSGSGDKANNLRNPDVRLKAGFGEDNAAQGHATSENSPDARAKGHRCDLCHSIFGRAGDLKRHRRTHFPENRCYHCHKDGCDRNGRKGFFRRDKFRDHQRKAHRNNESIGFFSGSSVLFSDA